MIARISLQSVAKHTAQNEQLLSQLADSRSHCSSVEERTDHERQQRVAEITELQQRLAELEARVATAVAAEKAAKEREQMTREL